MQSTDKPCPGCRGLENLLGLEAGKLVELESIRRHRRLRRGEFLFMDGEEVGEVFGISSGSFRLDKSQPDGKELMLDLALPGRLLGFRALVSGEAYSVSAMAREESSVCAYEVRAFHAFLGRHPQALAAATALVGRQLRDAREGLLERSAAPAPARLAHCLLQLELEHHHSSGVIRVTGQELASLIGTAPETVSRLLARFTSSGALAREGRRIFIRDRRCLELAAASKI